MYVVASMFEETCSVATSTATHPISRTHLDHQLARWAGPSRFVARFLGNRFETVFVAACSLFRKMHVRKRKNLQRDWEAISIALGAARIEPGCTYAKRMPKPIMCSLMLLLRRRCLRRNMRTSGPRRMVEIISVSRC